MPEARLLFFSRTPNCIVGRVVVVTVVGRAQDKWGAGLLLQIFIPAFITRRGALPCAHSQSLLSKAPDLVDIRLSTAFIITA